MKVKHVVSMMGFDQPSHTGSSGAGSVGELDARADICKRRGADSAQQVCNLPPSW